MILSNIHLSGPAQVGLQTFAGGRQLVNLAGGQDSRSQQNKVQKIVVDLSKPPPSVAEQAQPVPLISRTVISGSGIISRQESSPDVCSLPLSLFRLTLQIVLADFLVSHHFCFAD